MCITEDNLTQGMWLWITVLEEQQALAKVFFVVYIFKGTATLKASVSHMQVLTELYNMPQTQSKSNEKQESYRCL